MRKPGHGWRGVAPHLVALLLATLVLVSGHVAIGQSIDPIASDLEFRRYHIAEGAPVTANEMESLVGSYPGFFFVALASPSPVGADLLAEDLLDRFGAGTVVVLTPDEVGAVSSHYDDASLGAALDEMVAESDSYAVDFGQVAAHLTGQTAPEPAGGGIPWLAIVGVGLVGVIGFSLWRSNRRQKESIDYRLDQERGEIRHQMDVIADQIVRLADDPRTEQNLEALAHYRSASETFSAAEARLAAAKTLVELEDLSEDLDRARWELEATDALTEGRPPPPAPIDEKPEHCFFDPTHGVGVEEAEITTAAGTRKVMVCKADAEKLRRGEAPVPRDLPMGQQRVPAPQAPRSTGGLGMDWLDVFSILVGGMGQGVPYNWPRQSRQPRIGLPFPSRSGSRSIGSASRSRAVGSSARPRGRARRTR